MLATLVLAASALNCHGKAIHPEPKLPIDWSYHESTLSDVSFRISLKQPGVQQLIQIAKRVSDPSDSMYGKYLSQEELDELLLPPKEALDAVTEWVGSSCSASATREVVSITCGVADAEWLLETTCRMVRNSKTTQTAVRCTDFSLPSNVHNLTQAVYGLHGLPMPPRRASTAPSEQPASVTPVTPAVLASTYKIGGVNVSRSEKNRQAVAEFQGQTMSTADLDTFWKMYLPNEQPEHGKVHKFVGDQGTGASETEADLDIQYIMGVAPGILTEFWMFHPMDFCGDLKNWTHTILSDKSPPLVHSVSYGWQGNITTLTGCRMDNVNDVDLDFAKLAARGITIVFASGDSGAGYHAPEAQCHPPESLHKDVSFVGTIAQTHEAPSAETCCSYGSRYQGWTFEPPVMESCKKQTVVEGVAFDGSPEHVSANSSEACCHAATQMKRAVWSFDKMRMKCSVFYDIRGRHEDPSVVSGMGSPQEEGVCKVYSSITGNMSNPGASSGASGAATAQLYPSWPASSPWVTAVGSTRFVNQKVGADEMATDQFGSGGGFSDMFDAFDAQSAYINQYLKVAPQLPPDGSFSRGGRGTPDVSGLGEGYQVVIEGRPESVGGTSASAPMFAGLVSLLNEARMQKNMSAMGFINPWLYKHANAFTDVAIGDNLRGRGPFVAPLGFNCTKGWDPVTGLGTPRFDAMLKAATAFSATDLVV